MEASSLARRCQDEFEPNDWRIARHYWAAGRVAITEADAGGFDAIVHDAGAASHEVSFDWSDSREGHVLRASCTCSRFLGGRLCKHIAAGLLAADSKQLKHLPPGSAPLTVIADDDADDYWEVTALDHDGWDDDLASSILVGAFSEAMPPKAKRRNWRRELLSLAVAPSAPSAPPKPVDDHLFYRFNLSHLRIGQRLLVEFVRRRRKKDGTLGKPTAWSVTDDDLVAMADPADREVLGLMIGVSPREQYYSSYMLRYSGQGHTSCELSPASCELLLPRLCATGRFGWIADASHDEDLHVLRWDDGPPWQFKLRVEADNSKTLRLGGVLSRENETAPLDNVVAALDGYIVFTDTLARLAPGVNGAAIVSAQQTGEIRIPRGQADRLIECVAEAAGLPPLELPEELRWQETAPEPRPRLSVSQSKYGGDRSDFEAVLSFEYEGQLTNRRDSRPHLLDKPNRRIVHRTPAAEAAAWKRLFELGAKPPPSYYGREFDAQVPRKKFARLAAELTEAGWHVEAQGNVIRRAGSFHVSVSSGVDWFDLDATIDYDGVKAGLPELLAAAQRGDSFVTLGDGTQGMLPAEWLARYAPLALMGEVAGEKLRFQHSQALLLDAWLAAQPDVDLDAEFHRMRERLASFDGIRPRDEPAGFIGELRPYQREGLGWLTFLDELGFGGCLADDMGLGKTIQVLAMFAQRRGRPVDKKSADKKSTDKAPTHAPSLIVVPRSLVQNWLQEAARFTPQLRVLDYTGLGRGERRGQFDEFDLVVTTYGTVRRDAGHLKDIVFEYAVLDEAQAIKNSASQAAKACRLLQARRKLAMTGTPIENHLGELWSIFEFLNPGMLGRSNTLTRLAKGGPDNAEAVGLLSKALRPFILRRTKEQVLKDLPEKTEQTLYCELDARQRKLYDELRNHYRAALAKRIEKVGIKRAKIHVLEALLRLRQAALHPGLLDRTKRGQPSAKLETLLEQLDEIKQEGHKALVFSQFTSLLAIVREQLDARHTTYEYLDGQTRDRQARVDRFQQDPDCPLFLISLKAGGLGLNLTAADYVFILDPWWNPAVEAQAVDRAHRIGQTQRVFAYRLIARDTVEEKILQLQGEKRKLAEAIITADNSLISQLTADDLQLLLS